jgi:hypothetical protein
MAFRIGDAAHNSFSGASVTLEHGISVAWQAIAQPCRKVKG